MSGTQFLLVATLAGPLVLLLACIPASTRARVPGLLWAAPLPGLAAALLAAGTPPLVLDDARLRFTLMLDPPAALMLGAAALLWSAAGLYARAYLGRDAAARRFSAWWLVTQAGSLGVFIAGDLLSFYLLFAAVSLPAWGLIAQDGTARARDAAAVTLLLAVLGEVALLLGFVLLADAIPGPSIAIADAVAALRSGKAPDFALALIIAGFGLKAGLLPLHVWLPLAHPAAPMPASAVLSGAIVKAGIIGLLRLLPVDGTEAGWGIALAAIGFATAYWGVACGVAQANPKTVLAYSTVSQMGLLAAALGAGMAAGDAGTPVAVGFAALHHVLAKGALFLGIGVMAACGRRRGLLLVLLPALVLALGFGGAPLTGGGLAKAATKDQLGARLAGVLAFISAVGSTCLMLHFVRRLAAQPAGEDAPPAMLVLPWLCLAAAAIALPWLLFAPAGFGNPWATLADGGWVKALAPVLAGASAFLALRRWGAALPAVPEGDILHPVRRALRHAPALSDRIARAEAALGAWPAAGLALLLLVAAFALAGLP